MSPIDAVKTCLTKYVGFSGRARRSEYWWFALFTWLLSVIGAGLDTAFHLSFVSSTDNSVNYSSGPIQGLLSLAVLLPSLAVGIRRMHDIGKSGWWILVNLIPCVGWIWWIVLAVRDSEPDNQYGPNPKNPGAAAAPPPYGNGMR